MSLWIDADVMQAAIVSLAVVATAVLFLRFAPRKAEEKPLAYRKGAPKRAVPLAEGKYRGLGQAQGR